MTSSPYLLYYINPMSKKYESEPRHVLPDEGMLHVQGLYCRHWWYLELNADNVYVRAGQRASRSFKHWAGQFPDQWIDRNGSLRDAQGCVVFEGPGVTRRRLYVNRDES